MPRVGIKGKTYIEGNLAKWIRDLTVAISVNEVAVKNKGSEWEKCLRGLKTLPLDLEGDWSPGDPAFDALQEAFFADDEEGEVEVEILDAAKDKNGKGFKGKFIVTKFERSEPVEDVMGVSASFRLSALSNEDPEFV